MPKEESPPVSASAAWLEPKEEPEAEVEISDVPEEEPEEEINAAWLAGQGA